MRVLIHGDRRLSSVIEVLAQEMGCQLVIFGNGLGEQLNAQGIEFKQLENFLDESSKQKVGNLLPFYLERITSAWSRLRAHPQALPGASRVLSGCAAELENTARQSLIEALLLIEAFNSCHAELPIDVVCVLDDYPRPFMTITRAAQQRAVPVLHVAHGIYFLDVGRKLAADALAVPGWFNLDSLPLLGFDPSRIHVTGNPAWDYYSQLPSILPSRPEIKQQLGLDSEQPLILYGATWSDDREWHQHLARGFSALLDGLKRARLERCHVTVKPHPFGEAQLSLYERAAIAHGYSELSFCPEYKELLLWAADVVVLETTSSLMVEATLLNRPVVVLMTEAEKRYAFGAAGWPDDAILTCKPEPEALGPMLAELLGNGELCRKTATLIPATIEKFNCANDGNAARRVAKLLAVMAQGKKDQLPRAAFT